MGALPIENLGASILSGYADIFPNYMEILQDVIHGREVPIGTSVLIGGRLRPLFSKEINLEFLKIRSVPLPAGFPIKFPKAKPVILENGSLAFKNPRLVAVFPENWRGVKDRDYSLYFVDRFVKRTSHALKGLNGSVSGLDQLFALIDDNNALESLCAQWVTLHEYYHNQGTFPYPLHKKAKSTLHSSACEELRVDLLSIDWCLHQNSALLAEFIFFERVIRYGIQGNRENDCDSLSSAMAVNFLNQRGLLEFENGTLCVRNGALKEISALLEEIKIIEANTDESNLPIQLKKFCLEKQDTSFSEDLFLILREQCKDKVSCKSQ